MHGMTHANARKEGKGREGEENGRKRQLNQRKRKE
jgi:hypothetical protein